MPRPEILHDRLPMVAIIGRTNVGKSTLFNRLAGRRKAVVLDTPGVTRDRNFETSDWRGRAFTMIDTGGYETEPRDAVFEQMREQSLMAIEQSDAIVFMTDVTEPDNPVDRDVAQLLRRWRKPTILAVNKCDNPKRAQEALSFYAFGFDDLFPISSINGASVADMLDRLIEMLPPPEEDTDDTRLARGIQIAVIGRQNVGKSTLVNALLGRERVIVHEAPGTTRDTIDTTFRLNDKVYTIIDTAGIRRRGKIERGIEKLSVFSAEASLNRCDVALVVIDASRGLAEQDQHVAGYAHEAHRGCILIVNKWDLVEKDDRTAGAVAKMLRAEMGYLAYAPILMISAKTGQRVQKILGLVDQVFEESRKRIPTPALNDWLEQTQRRLSPPMHGGRPFRIKYVVQTAIQPPTFTFFVNDPRLLHFSYERYLINRLREAFGFEGVPLRLRMRRKSRRSAKEEQRES